MLRDVGPSLVGGWVLTHEGTIITAEAYSTCGRTRLLYSFSLMRGDRILTFLLMNPSALLAREQACVMCFVHFILSRYALLSGCACYSFVNEDRTPFLEVLFICCKPLNENPVSNSQ